MSATKPKIKHVNMSALKKKAWKHFSWAVRTKGAYDPGDGGLWNKCYTCGRIIPCKMLQAGHFIPGRHNKNLFDYRGCRPQCYVCNIRLKGNSIIYYKKMQEEVGQEVIDELMAQDRIPFPFTVEFLRQIIQDCPLNTP